MPTGGNKLFQKKGVSLTSETIVPSLFISVVAMFFTEVKCSDLKRNEVRM